MVDRCLGVILDFEILFVQLSQFGRKRFKPLKILFIVYRSIVYLVLEAHLEKVEVHSFYLLGIQSGSLDEKVSKLFKAILLVLFR